MSSPWDAVWSRLDVDRMLDGWDASAAPPILAEVEEALPRSGRALEIAGGPGLVATWLARRGLDVTLIDVSAVALQVAASVACRSGTSLDTRVVDLLHDPLPAGPWDLITALNWFDRRLYPLYPYLLAPGGILVVACPTTESLRSVQAGPLPPLVKPGELAGLLPSLQTVAYGERWGDGGLHLAWLAGRREGW